MGTKTTTWIVFNWDAHGSKAQFHIPHISSLQPSGDSSPCSSLLKTTKSQRLSKFLCDILFHFWKCHVCIAISGVSTVSTPYFSETQRRLHHRAAQGFTSALKLLSVVSSPKDARSLLVWGAFLVQIPLAKGGTIQWPSCVGVKPSIWLFSRWIREHMNTRFAFWLPKVDS